jgi:competence transcription factor ComK
MILIFDTYSGLCNQFYDIQCAINFCIINNIIFTFRYASFRNEDLVTWYNVPFSKLFDTTFLEKYPTYIDFDKLNLNNENTYNYDGKLFANQMLVRNNITEQLVKIGKPHIVLKQFWDTYMFNKVVEDVYRYLIPSEKIIKKYKEIKNDLNLIDNNYNFIHYRYEHDFINHFRIKNMKSLKDLILERKFTDKNLKIYIATTNIKKLLENDFKHVKEIILYKNENNLSDFNFEENAFIDFLIGLKSKEIYGHSNSSFSTMLNNLKATNNYYN